MAFFVQKKDFCVNHELAKLQEKSSNIGAIVTFTGCVRGSVNGQLLSEMFLEYYPGMTEAELERIENEATKLWSLQAIVIIHRYGKLQPGDRIVMVATASVDRCSAFEASQFIMDNVKKRATFWKKESFTNGESCWVDNREQDFRRLQR
ncbi:MAG: Molybdopterin synthase catalytic subunit [Hyphomicrobiaceae bacterium hypho_1]